MHWDRSLASLAASGGGAIMLESPRALAPARTGFVYFKSSFVDGMMIALVELQLKNSCDSPFCVRGLSMTDDEPREKVLAQHCCCHESERAKSADFFWQRLSFSSRGMSGSARYPTCRGTFPEFLLPPALPHAPNCHPQPRASREIPPSHSRRREGINTHTHTQVERYSIFPRKSSVACPAAV